MTLLTDLVTALASGEHRVAPIVRDGLRARADAPVAASAA